MGLYITTIYKNYEELQKMKRETAKLGIQELLPVAMLLVVTTIGAAFGLNVLSDVRDDFTANTEEYNATSDGIEGVAKIPSKMPLIATILVAALVIGILVTYMVARFRR
jgi:hypothetical protein